MYMHQTNPHRIVISDLKAETSMLYSLIKNCPDFKSLDIEVFDMSKYKNLIDRYPALEWLESLIPWIGYQRNDVIGYVAIRHDSFHTIRIKPSRKRKPNTNTLILYGYGHTTEELIYDAKRVLKLRGIEVD